MEKFNIGDTFRFAWQMYKKHIGFFFWYILVAATLVYSETHLRQHAVETYGSVPFLLHIFLQLIQLGLLLGQIQMALRICSGGKPHCIDMIACFDHRLLTMVGASMIHGLIVIIGFCLLIIPGISWSFKFGQYIYFIVDKKVGVIDSLRRSAVITKGEKSHLFGFTISLFLLTFVVLFILALPLGFITPFIEKSFGQNGNLFCYAILGTLPVPFFAIAGAYVYCRLQYFEYGDPKEFQAEQDEEIHSPS